MDFLGLALAHPNVPGSRIAIMAAVASASLVWAPASRAASASTLRALERYNDGVCDRQRQPVPHGLSVRAAWRAMQRRGAHNSVRIARVGGIDAASSPDHAGGTRTEQRGRVRRSTPACASWAVGTCGVTCDTAPRHCRMRSHRSSRRHRRGQQPRSRWWHSSDATRHGRQLRVNFRAKQHI